jgi:hypothetical protein
MAMCDKGIFPLSHAYSPEYINTYGVVRSIQYWPAYPYPRILPIRGFFLPTVLIRLFSFTDRILVACIVGVRLDQEYT